jgi:hypothetical protein
MLEKPSMGDMRPKTKELPFTPLQVKELADLISKPLNHFHYEIKGEWQPNRDVYRVHEGDKVISDYTFPQKSDTSKAQFAERKTYTKELNMWGNLKEKPVSFDRKTGTWKKLGLVESIKYVFKKETNIPAQVVTEEINGKEVATLHTLEQKRPVGEAVNEVTVNTVNEAKIELGLKYKHVEHVIALLRQEKNQLEHKLTVSAATNVALERELAKARQDLRNLHAQAVQREAQAVQAAKEAQPHYEGPIHTKPNPADVVDGEIVDNGDDVMN